MKEKLQKTKFIGLFAAENRILNSELDEESRMDEEVYMRGGGSGRRHAPESEHRKFVRHDLD